MGSSQRIHLLAPEAPYEIHMTLEAADDLEDALCLEWSQKDLARFASDLRRAVERISGMPHLGRFHHGRLRVTALSEFPYRIWYVLNEKTRTAILLGIVNVARPTLESGRPPGPWRKVWWWDLPHLPPLLPDPYPPDEWTQEWEEEDDQWWLPRMPGREVESLNPEQSRQD